MTEEYPIYSPRKLIEVALPLDAINTACKREKSIRYGHPSTLHLWWARRPLAAARAVIFSQLVHDPEDLWYYQNLGKEPNKQVRGHWTKARARLFKIIEDLVLWENTTNQDVLNVARAEIRKSWEETCELNKDHPKATELFAPENMPGLHDPFAGGGTIPLEAQRLGLDVYASDLNPVAVLINRAMIDIAPTFAGMPPVNPASQANKQLVEREWKGAEGLAEDVRYYGKWMRDEAEQRIGHLYPKLHITDAIVEERPDLEPYRGKKLTIIAWLWARTVKSPNPAFSHVDVPLVSSFLLSQIVDRESYIQPIITECGYNFAVRTGTPPATAKDGTSAGKRRAFRCLMSEVPIGYDYIREEGKAGRIGQKLLAIVAEGRGTRLYLTPTEEQEKVAGTANPKWKPDCEIPKKHRNFQPPGYGMSTFGDLFTPRQLVALTTFSDLILEVKTKIEADVGESASKKYADAVATYLAFMISKLVDKNSTICTWDIGPTSTRSASGRSARAATVRSTFSRQALPMTWDFAEVNIFSDSVGSADTVLRTLSTPLGYLPEMVTPGKAWQMNASENPQDFQKVTVSTDPPYYDNICYADLSDFFYIWLRRSLRAIHADIMHTMAVPKVEELVATATRHGTKENAERFFLDGMTQAMRVIAKRSHPSTPVTIYYAFKQSETKATDGTSSTGWVAFLEALHRAGLALTGTWPIRTELGNRMVGSGANVLASSIVLVCRSRFADAPTVSRRDFIRELNATLPAALDAMTHESENLPSPVAPVDLSQAIIGPGMAVFSKYSAVLEADGEPMTVRTALQLINRFLAEDDFDKDTQFCLHWFEQYGWDEGVFGEADVLARAKATAVDALAEAGVIQSGGGKVKLLRWSEYPTDWDPTKDSRTPVWEALHHLIRGLKHGGESEAGQLLAGVQSQAEAARQLAYRLYTLCERKGWAEDASAYNELITSWSGIETATPRVEQGKLF